MNKPNEQLIRTPKFKNEDEEAKWWQARKAAVFLSGNPLRRLRRTARVHLSFPN
jgi:hypothetical protein